MPAKMPSTSSSSRTRRTASRGPTEKRASISDCVVQLGDEALVEVAQAVDQLAVPRLGRDDPHLGLVLAEEPADAHQGAGGAEPGDEVGDRRQVGEQLGAGALVVREGVGLVAVLVEHHPVGVLGGDLLGDPRPPRWSRRPRARR